MNPDYWHFATQRSALPSGGRKMVRVDGRQIAFFDTANGILACNNLCPHEGYPLSEGSLSGECTLTCNWHNWKFDLATGENLYGGDRLRTYPVELRGDEIWINLEDPPFDEALAGIIANLKQAFDDESYDRIAREIARLMRLGADPMEALRRAVHWSWRKMEFGWTHAYAGMTDWLRLYDEFAGDEQRRLICLVESVSHAAHDVLRERDYPYSDDIRPYDEEGFIAAIEGEEEGTAVAMVRGGLDAGLAFNDMERGFARAALSHYQDFGHSLIYVDKVGELIDRLGDSVAGPLLFSLVRSLVFASREDLIPEFRHYGPALARWSDAQGDSNPDAANWRGRGIRTSLDLALASSRQPPLILYRELLLANAWNLLHFDISTQDKIEVSVSGNVNWLDFSHGLTFANAVRRQCTRHPDLWPAGLLQMACFQGRNAAYTSGAQTSDVAAPNDWRAPDALEAVMNHGQGEPIVSVHLLKTTLAIREEADWLGDEGAESLFAGLRRFLTEPLKRRQPRRTAWQSLRFVDRELGAVDDDR